ncbi:MAG: PAS domain S-box protein [Thermomicrobiales bacterium]
MGTLEHFFASCPDPIIGKAPDGTIIFWNPSAEQLYGYSAREAVGQSIALIVPPSQMGELERRLKLVNEGQTVTAYETVRRASDGRLLDISLTIFPMRDAHGQIVGSAAIARDITQHRKNTAALAESQRQFRAAFGDAAHGMALIGLDDRFLEVNPAICDLLGRDEAELLTLLAADVVHPDDVEKERAASRQAILTRARGYSLELRIVRPDGAERPVRAQTSLVPDDEGNPAYFIAQVHDLTERVAARETLAEAHQTIQEVLERVGGAFLELDADWRIIRANGEAARLLQRAVDALLGQPFQAVATPGLLALVMPALQEVMTTRQATDVPEFWFDDRDLWLSLHASPTADGVTLHLRDTTASRQVERDLRPIERRFQTLVEQLPAAVYVHADTDDEAMLYLSPYCATLLGYERTEDVPFQTLDSWLAHIHPEDRDRVLHDMAMRDATRNVWMLEYRQRRADGTYIWVNDGYAEMHNEAGERIAWVGVLIDITERKQAGELVSRLAAVVEASDDAIFTRTPDGIITYWNPAAERLYGYTAEEIIGQPVTVLFPAGDDRHLKMPDAFDGASALRFETQDLRRDGTRVDVAATVSLVRDATGAVTSVSGIARDITARREAEQALRTALEAAEAGERAKALFLAMMSHELRTPLQAVLGYADFLLSGRQGDLTPEQREDITYIHLGAGRMVTLIEQMLDLSRMEAGQLNLRRERVDVPEVMELVRQDIAPQAEAKAIALHLSAPARLPQALGDRDRIRQILLNLAGNAVKFTEAGSVTLEARQRQGWLEVAVSDTGIGIAETDIPGIFDEYQQVDGNLTRRYGGAGLGLAIARRLAEQMSGEITVTSTPGVGSTFTVRLPVASQDPAETGAERAG